MTRSSARISSSVVSPAASGFYDDLIVILVDGMLAHKYAPRIEMMRLGCLWDQRQKLAVTPQVNIKMDRHQGARLLARCMQVKHTKK